MAASLSSPNATTTNATYIAQITNQIHNHQAWMKAWLVNPAVPTSLSLQVQQLRTDSIAFDGWTQAWLSSYSAMNSDSAITLLQLMVLTYEGWLQAWLWTAGAYGPPSTSLPSAASSLPVPTSEPGSQTVSFTSVSTPGSTSIPAPSPFSTFNPMAPDNVMVYWGQTPQTQNVSLDTICKDKDINMVTVAFVNGFYDNTTGAGWPTVNFGPSMCNPTTVMIDKNATGLTFCPDLAKQIAGCQDAGKIVLLSLGGYIIADGQSIDFANDTQAQNMAGTLWNLFGAGTDLDPGLRPFGSVVIDGFDIDTEDKHPASWTTFATALRAEYAKSPSRPFYLSGAPQCPFPDMSIPLSTMQLMDFVLVQFYDNAQAKCNVGQDGFLASFSRWSSALAQNQTVPGKPMLYLMALAMNPGYGTGYVDIASLQQEIASVKALTGATNFGGVGLWDGSQAVLNGNYQAAVKGVLTGRITPAPGNASANTTAQRRGLAGLRL
ncbi:hypothetical protein MMC13_005077 [Lambiella insularis]|nr:hypothetical protein [Lambiella insularis]